MTNELDNELNENTEATNLNTQVTAQSNVASSGISKMTALVAGMLIVATCYISYINPTFAENQSGIIFSGIAGGIFGATMTRK